MQMTKTSNYQLNQWAATDQVRRTDFNADNQKIDAALKALSLSAGNCKIVQGSYVGAGQYGPSNKNVISFSGKPIFVFVHGACCFSALYGTAKAAVLDCESNAYYYLINLTWSGNTLSWYYNENALPHNQLNAAGKTYHYIALLQS